MSGIQTHGRRSTTRSVSGRIERPNRDMENAATETILRIESSFGSYELSRISRRWECRSFLFYFLGTPNSDSIRFQGERLLYGWYACSAFRECSAAFKSRSSDRISQALTPRKLRQERRAATRPLVQAKHIGKQLAGRTIHSGNTRLENS